ncbi:hypothetical protein NDU88_003456 [Pleurodeles waltl]|uniref:Uncharacterized protein n=1 Tax=Pleurodeles waltl TaxID=8319 RepID=A0AAV7TQN9_PLEWA|nr:hypothetical protein NDU88_003456 [Pleurodeles waltl]
MASPRWEVDFSLSRAFDVRWGLVDAGESESDWDMGTRLMKPLLDENKDPCAERGLPQGQESSRKPYNNGDATLLTARERDSIYNQPLGPRRRSHSAPVTALPKAPYHLAVRDASLLPSREKDSIYYRTLGPRRRSQSAPVTAPHKMTHHPAAQDASLLTLRERDSTVKLWAPEGGPRVHLS